MIDAVISRLVDRVPDLAGRTEAAADLASLMAANALPQSGVGAHVLPAALQGSAADVVAGMYRQSVEEVVTVLLTFRALGRTGDQAISRVREITRAVITAVAGWAPEDTPGVFRLVRGGIVAMSGGTLVYQLDFAITDQLRITP